MRFRCCWSWCFYFYFAVVELAHIDAAHYVSVPLLTLMDLELKGSILECIFVAMNRANVFRVRTSLFSLGASRSQVCIQFVTHCLDFCSTHCSFLSQRKQCRRISSEAMRWITGASICCSPPPCVTCMGKHG